MKRCSHEDHQPGEFQVVLGGIPSEPILVRGMQISKGKHSKEKVSTGKVPGVFSGILCQCFVSQVGQRNCAELLMVL